MFGVCGICEVPKNAQKYTEKRPSIDDTKRSNRTTSDSEDERISRRRPLRRNESDEEERRIVRRHPSRSTRSPTYHEEESDDEIRERTPKKRRVLPSRSAAANTRHEESITFPRIEESTVRGVVNEVMNLVFRETGTEEKQLVLSIKMKLRSVVAVGIRDMINCSGSLAFLEIINEESFI